MRYVRIGEKGDVGDAVIADEEIVLRQVIFHDLECGPAAVALGCEQRCLFRRVGFVLQPEAGRGDERFVAVLLEEHPLKNVTERFSIFREKFGAFGQISEDGVGFSQDETVVVQHRRAAVGIDLEKFRRAAFSLQNVDFDDFARDAEVREQQADFVGVAGIGDVV